MPTASNSDNHQVTSFLLLSASNTNGITQTLETLSLNPENFNKNWGKTKKGRRGGATETKGGGGAVKLNVVFNCIATTKRVGKYTTLLYLNQRKTPWCLKK